MNKFRIYYAISYVHGHLILKEHSFILGFCRTIVLHLVHVDISTKDTYKRMYQKPVAVHHEVFCPLVHMRFSPVSRVLS